MESPAVPTGAPAEPIGAPTDPAGAPAEPVGTASVDRRQRKARQTRNALATAAVDLILELGLAATTVEAIAERADVTRRTFSRHFTGKEDAALDFVRGDGDRINALLRTRPAAEPPLLAYRRAVRDWLADRENPAWHLRPRMRRLLALVDREPALFAAYERIRVDAQEESIRILADRLGTDDVRDVRPAVVVDAAAGVLTAALRIWARRTDEHDSGAADLAALVERAYDALIGEAADAASRSTTEE
ncbi:TetR/AcrR family transcriptional regulator [Streptomyces sp. NPDC088196]|uniref:TetR/AcrR family transcriptional regulator n=1 Tax=Streptomyces sp. NPDC088196 TaxID=3154868 RepID=UPI00344B8B9C